MLQTIYELFKNCPLMNPKNYQRPPLATLSLTLMHFIQIYGSLFAALLLLNNI